MKEDQAYYYASTEDTNTIYDVYELFNYYNLAFFQSELSGCVVRWSKKMTLCAGTCQFVGFGSSTISLSEPLLKFRTNNELKETLIHEMIHAYLFKTNMAACKIEGGHGPQFKSIMFKINSITGLNISVYHNFHDEVKYYRQHIWRCDGRCREEPPYYGYVKRSMNRAPQAADYWFNDHRRTCGGQFIKIGDPQKEIQGKQKEKKRRSKVTSTSRQKDHKGWGYGKSIEDYMKQMQKDKKKRKESAENAKPQQAQDSIESLHCESKEIIDRKKGGKEKGIKKEEEKLEGRKFNQSQRCKTIEEYCQQIQEQNMRMKESKQTLQPIKKRGQESKSKQKFEQVLKKYL